MADAPNAAAPAAAPIAPTVNANADGSGVTPAAPNAMVKKAAAPAPTSSKKNYKIKVDGKEESVDFDSANEDEVRRHLQMSKAAYKRMQESADMRKGVDELLTLLRTDPLKVLSDPRLNLDPNTRKRMAESIINNEIEEMQKSPEQRDRERMQREYENLKQQHEQERKARESAEFQRLQEQQVVQYDTDISSAIEKSGMPKTARTVRYYAEALKFCLQNGLDLSPDDLTPYIKKQATSEFRDLLGLMPDDEFEQFLGKDQLSRIRKRNIAKAKSAMNPANIKNTGAGDKPKEGKVEEKQNIRDFFKSLGTGKF